MKQCAHCKEFKHLDEFAYSNKILKRRQKHCRDCMRKFNRQSYLRRSEKRKQQVAEDKQIRRAEAKQFIWDYLTKRSCVDCTAGYTIFQRDGDSPSFNRQIRLSSRKWKAGQVIEYAIWWDWDINHLYELEHIWVYLDEAGQVIKVEGSWHGEVRDLAVNGRLLMKGTHPIVFAAPGKHAFAAKIGDFQRQQAKAPGITTRFAGAMGIAINGLFNGLIERSPPVDRLIHGYLRDWIKSIHQTELGIILTASDSSNITWLRTLGVEILELGDDINLSCALA